jgi:hypothetical protein
MGKHVMKGANQRNGRRGDYYRVPKYAPPQQSAASLEASRIEICERHTHMRVTVNARAK